MGSALDRDTIEKAYARWAPVYDVVFGRVFEQGRMASIAAAEQHVGAGGGRILEVGVGTGISLSSYQRNHRIVGIDISAPMLRRAQERVAEQGLDNVEALAVMDAKHLALPDASFDVVVAQYVITAVPDPEATLDEFLRVLKPGGEIVLVNHLGADVAASAGARRRARLEQCRGIGGDGRQASRVAGCVVRRGGGAIRHHGGARSRGNA